MNLLASKSGWDIHKAIALFVDANQLYWTPITYYLGAFDVLSATGDVGYWVAGVTTAFVVVG